MTKKQYTLDDPEFVCQNYRDDGTHYKYGHWVAVGPAIQCLCTKCCDSAKAQGARVRWASEDEIRIAREAA